MSGSPSKPRMMPVTSSAERPVLTVVVVEIHELASLPATWLIGDTSLAPDARAVKPTARVFALGQTTIDDIAATLFCGAGGGVGRDRGGCVFCGKAAIRFTAASPQPDSVPPVAGHRS
jgi:hypothetical protein